MERIKKFIKAQPVLTAAFLVAVMLSGFTENGRELLLGVNIGGLGTIIASLASLISFQYYRASEGAKTGRYMLTFTLVNFGMLAALMIMS